MPVGARIGLRRRRQSAAGPTTDPAIAALRADGWGVDHALPLVFDPVGAPRYLALSRAGFDSFALSAIHAEALLLTQRVRQPYPNQSALEANRVALSDYVYATDGIVGGPANASVEASPKPVARWALPDRRKVGPTLRLEIVAAHRNARNREQVAAVKFTWSDGAVARSAVVSQSTILAGVNDRHPIVGYALDADLTGMADGQITANAEVYPWIGGAASVARSADNSAGTRAFCPQVFRKVAARIVLYAYVDTAAATPAGNDTTGVASSNPATAAASPCLTVAGAFAKLRAAGDGFTDGHVIRLKSGVQAMGTPAAVTHSSIAECVIEADPAAGSTPVFALTANWNSRHAYLRFRNVTVARTTTAQITGAFVTFENCTVQNAATITMNGGASIFGWQGCIVTGATAAMMAPTSSAEHRLVRGTSFDAATTIDPFCSIGNLFVNANHGASTAAQESGFVAFNRFNGQAGTAVTCGSIGNVDGFAMLQNLVEWTSTSTTAPAFRFSGDSNTGNVTHLVCHYNTLTGWLTAGRGNLLYADTAATDRTHKLCSFVGNIHVQINTKHDVFASTAANVNAWAYLYGVGCRGEFSQFVDASSGGLGSAFAQAYPGFGASIGTSNSVRNNPLFTDYKGTVSAAVAGAGGGTYTLQAGSPCLGRVANPVLRFDLAGNPRPASNDASGAYLAA
jgi:hypothetical protein